MDFIFLILDEFNCVTPPTVDNAIYSQLDGDIQYGARLQYNCSTGYNLDGNDIISCQLNNSWSLPTPSCSIVNCGNPGAPVNGYTNGSVFTYQSIVQYYCNEGYQLSGGSSAQCTAAGDWNVTLPNCTLVNCGDPGIPDNGARNGDNFYYNSTITYSCNIGYNLTGTATLTCLSNGTWNESIPTCPPVNCGDPGTPDNGSRSGDIFTYNSVVLFQCSVGYSLSGSASLLCLSSVSWNASVPSCVAGCSDPGVPTNGQRSGEMFSHNSVVTYSCNTGYTLIGANSLMCLQNNSWNNTRPSCTPVNCGDPGTITNGDRAGDVFTYQAQIIYSCHDDFSLVGSQAITCQSNGSWSDTVPVCTHIDCTDPGIPANGVRIGNDFSYNSSVSFSCYPGYQLNGSGVITCGINNIWNTSVPSCDNIYCSAPVVPDNGNVSYTSLSANSSVYFTCNTGYTPIGNTNITCLPNGQWSNASVPSCNIIVCPPLTPPSHGYLTPPNQYIYGTIVTVNCDSGYDLVGTSTLTCIGSGYWSNPLPQCIKGEHAVIFCFREFLFDRSNNFFY